MCRVIKYLTTQKKADNAYVRLWCATVSGAEVGTDYV